MTFVVCEDGSEYTERFRRFLGEEFSFVRATHFAEALAATAGATAVLLDLDFRRTDPALLVGEGAAIAEVQGILLLKALRARGVTLPAILFADLDDPQRVAQLQRELAPLQIVPSDEGLPAIARRLRAI